MIDASANPAKNSPKHLWHLIDMWFLRLARIERPFIQFHIGNHLGDAFECDFCCGRGRFGNRQPAGNLATFSLQEFQVEDVVKQPVAGELALLPTDLSIAF